MWTTRRATGGNVGATRLTAAGSQAGSDAMGRTGSSRSSAAAASGGRRHPWASTPGWTTEPSGVLDHLRLAALRGGSAAGR